MQCYVVRVRYSCDFRRRIFSFRAKVVLFSKVLNSSFEEGHATAYETIKLGEPMCKSRSFGLKDHLIVIRCNYRRQYYGISEMQLSCKSQSVHGRRLLHPVSFQNMLRCDTITRYRHSNSFSLRALKEDGTA